MLLVGDQDPMGPRASEIIRDHMAGALLEVVPGRGHWLHVDAPEVVLAAIDRVLGEAIARDGEEGAHDRRVGERAAHPERARHVGRR